MIGHVSVVLGLAEGDSLLPAPPFRGPPPRIAGSDGAEKGVQPPELVRGQGECRKFPNPGAVSWKNRRIWGRSAWDKNVVKMWSVCRNLQSHHLCPSWSKMLWQAALLLHPAHLPKKRARIILGNKWSAVDMRVLTL